MRGARFATTQTPLAFAMLILRELRIENRQNQEPIREKRGVKIIVLFTQPLSQKMLAPYKIDVGAGGRKNRENNSNQLPFALCSDVIIE
ncbi:MAG: hypothetical protein C0410_13535 [Anaerolinea sp.]|nr:hypothetical protein [Anaerolinea sp.]